MSAPSPGLSVSGQDVIITNAPAVASVTNPVVSASEKTTLTTPPVTATTAGNDTDTLSYWARNAFNAFRDAFIIINVTAASGTTPSIAFFIDVLGPDGVTWFNVFAFTAITGVGASSKFIGQHGGAQICMGGTVRVRWTAPTGTTPSFTFTVQAILES